MVTLVNGKVGACLSDCGNRNGGFVFGDSEAFAGGSEGSDFLGNNDIVTIFGSNDVAFSGATSEPGDFDLADIFGSDLGTAYATGANYSIEILPSLTAMY